MAGLSNQTMVKEVQELQFLIGQQWDAKNTDLGNAYCVYKKLISHCYFVPNTLTFTPVKTKVFNYGVSGNVAMVSAGGTATAFTANGATTNWPGQNNSLPTNVMEVLMDMGIEFFVADVTAGSQGQVLGGLPTVAALEQASRSISISLKEGNLTEFNYGLAEDWPSGAGAYVGAALGVMQTNSNARFDLGVQNGGPLSRMNALPAPFILKPLVNYDWNIALEQGFVAIDGFAQATSINGNPLTGKALGMKVAFTAWEIALQT